MFKAGYKGIVVGRWTSSGTVGISIERLPALFQVTRSYLSWGINIGITWGKGLRPVGNIFRKGTTPWKGGHWFVIRFPWFCGFWFHVWKWRGADHPARFYIGMKLFYVDSLPKDPWAKDDERGKYAVTPSISLRRGK